MGMIENQQDMENEAALDEGTTSGGWAMPEKIGSSPTGGFIHGFQKLLAIWPGLISEIFRMDSSLGISHYNRV